jgi:hypothetical protein
MMAVRAFITMACILSGLATGCFVICALKSVDSNRLVILATKVLCIASLVTGIIGMAVGATFGTDESSGQGGTTGQGGGSINVSIKVGAAAILAVVADVFNLVGIVLAAMIN